MLLRLVAYILVGAGKTLVLEAWMGLLDVITLPTTIKAVYVWIESNMWKSHLICGTAISLVEWHPEGLADSAYDFATKKYDETWLGSNVSGKLRRVLKASSVTQFVIWNTGNIDIPSHPLRLFCPGRLRGTPEMRYKYARLLLAAGHQASGLFARHGRSAESKQVLSMVFKLWGQKSTYMQVSHGLDEESGEQLKLQAQAMIREWELRNPKILKHTRSILEEQINIVRKMYKGKAA
ncbi:hypothetical protein F4808DRAFT_470609 [Astrocystis sublimbata]|nr:hypothetical protein F4808DRAFT_470609 [Astrocystis sublimbata]